MVAAIHLGQYERLFYLWHDVFRRKTDAVFVAGIRTYDELVSTHTRGERIFRAELGLPVARQGRRTL